MPSICASWGILQASSELKKWPKPTVHSGLLCHHATAWNQWYQNCEEIIKKWIDLMVSMLIVWWRNMWHAELPKCKRKMSSSQHSAGPGSSTWKSKSSSSRQSVCIATVRILGLCGRKSINTLLMLPPVCALLYQSFLQDLLPATAFKAALQKRCNGLADSSRS